MEIISCQLVHGSNCKQVFRGTLQPFPVKNGRARNKILQAVVVAKFQKQNVPINQMVHS